MAFLRYAHKALGVFISPTNSAELVSVILRFMNQISPIFCLFFSIWGSVFALFCYDSERTKKREEAVCIVLFSCGVRSFAVRLSTLPRRCGFNTKSCQLFLQAKRTATS